jgi:PKD repeat protein
MGLGIFTKGTAPMKSLPRPLRALVHWGICLLALVLSVSALHAQNAIQIENAKQGTSDWQLTNLADDGNSYTNVIEGYASLTSVPRGGQITFYVNVSTPGDSYTMNIYRMGWYGGLGARAVLSVGPLLGVQQPMPVPDPVTGLLECDWSPTYTLTLNSTTDPVSNWVSGVYLVLLTDISSGPTNGLQRYMIFVVNDPASISNYLFQCAVNTYQAFNDWGGKSLFAFDSDSSGPATKVSFNRPYERSYGYDGSGDFLTGWEYDMVRFLEREGYDVSYDTEVDAHESPSLLMSHKALLIVGHPEYWTMAMRTNVVAARDSGESLGIFAGVVCLWQVRFEPSVVNGAADRNMVGYKDFATSFTAPGPDPYYAACTGTGVPQNTADCPLVTTQWREPPVNMPENAFVGVMWADDDPVDGDILITNASNPVFNTTGLQNNNTLPGLLGYETDSLYDNGYSPAGIVTLAASPYTVTDTTTTGVSDMTIYTAASGATVFTAGTFQFSWGLDDYSTERAGLSSLVNFGAQQMTRNLMADLIGDQPPLANPGGPYTGANLQSVQFDGTGSSAPVGTIANYQWDFGDGTAGTGSLPTHTYSLGGTYTVTLIVTNSQGSRNAATTTATISGPDNAAIASLAPASLSFGNQPQGTISPAMTLMLSNTGNVTLTITSIVVAGDYSETDNCGGSVAAGSSCIIAVAFAPTQAGARPGAITITDNSDAVTGSTQTVALSGTGTGPSVSLSASSLAFPAEIVGTSSAQSIMLTNTGNASLKISSITVGGGFSQTNNCVTTVNPGASCTISVIFKPLAAGTYTGGLSIYDNAFGSPQSVALSGTGMVLTVGPQPPVVPLRPPSLPAPGHP